MVNPLCRHLAAPEGCIHGQEELAKRVLNKLPLHQGAHELLGHVFALDQWHRSLKEAKSELRSAGFLSVRNGFIAKEDLSLYRQDKSAWACVNLVWKNRVDLGHRRWRGEWFVGEEAEMVPILEKLKKRMGFEANARQKGRCRVYTSHSKEKAKEYCEVHG